jgi:uncharacterized membrane protein
MTLFLAFLIGLFGGLRSLTAPAATAWAAYLGWLKLARPLALIGSLPAVAIFTLLAIVELVADKLPQTPSRTAPLGLIARIVMGGLTGACVAAAGGQGIFLGAVLGAVAVSRAASSATKRAPGWSRPWARGISILPSLRISLRSPALFGWYRKSE